MRSRERMKFAWKINSYCVVYPSSGHVHNFNVVMWWLGATTAYGVRKPKSIIGYS